MLEEVMSRQHRGPGFDVGGGGGKLSDTIPRRLPLRAVIVSCIVALLRRDNRLSHYLRFPFIRKRLTTFFLVSAHLPITNFARRLIPPAIWSLDRRHPPYIGGGMWRYLVGPSRLRTSVSTSQIKLEAGTIEEIASTVPRRFGATNDGKP